MLENELIKINVDGVVHTTNAQGVTIKEFTGGLEVLHNIVYVMDSTAKEKQKFRNEIKLFKPEFFIGRADKNEYIEVSYGHIKQLSNYIIQGEEYKDFVKTILKDIKNLEDISEIIKTDLK